MRTQADVIKHSPRNMRVNGELFAVLDEFTSIGKATALAKKVRETGKARIEGTAYGTMQVWVDWKSYIRFKKAARKTPKARARGTIGAFKCSLCRRDYKKAVEVNIPSTKTSMCWPCYKRMAASGRARRGYAYTPAGRQLRLPDQMHLVYGDQSLKR